MMETIPKLTSLNPEKIPNHWKAEAAKFSSLGNGNHKMKSRDGIHGRALQRTISTGVMTNVLFTMPHDIST